MTRHDLELAPKTLSTTFGRRFKMVLDRKGGGWRCENTCSCGGTSKRDYGIYTELLAVPGKSSMLALPGQESACRLNLSPTPEKEYVVPSRKDFVRTRIDDVAALAPDADHRRAGART